MINGTEISACECQHFIECQCYLSMQTLQQYSYLNTYMHGKGYSIILCSLFSKKASMLLQQPVRKLSSVAKQNRIIPSSNQCTACSEKMVLGNPSTLWSNNAHNHSLCHDNNQTHSFNNYIHCYHSNRFLSNNIYYYTNNLYTI